MNQRLQQTILVLIMVLTTTAIFAQKKIKYSKAYFEKFPSYEEVIEAYFKVNEFDYKTISKTKIAKKYDGWYIIYLNDKFEEDEKRRIWNAQNASFENLKNEDLEDGGNAAIEKGKKHFLRGFDFVWYEQYPVYGYHGYENDVIELLENEENLSAKLLDALARSYSSKSMETINPGQFGGKKKIMEYDRSFNHKDWDKEVLETFMLYADKSIATFKILSDKYPNYQTLVGNIKTKYRNEHMAAYYALKFSGKAELAEKYLVDDLYPEFQIKTAINYLKTCATNAILFTYGDNDTYPLIYAQDKLGIRTDIKIINTSLASLGRYINFVKTEYNLPTTLSMDEYKLDNNDYMLIKEEIEDVDLRDYFKAVNEDKNIYIDDTGVRYLPAKQVFFVIQTKPLGYQLGISKRLSEAAAQFDFGKSYLTKGEIFMFDLITTDNWQTPVYFSTGGFYTLKSLGIEDYVQVEGLAYRFLPKGTHDITLLETNILYSFKYQEDNAIDWFSSSNSIHLSYYQTAFLELLKFRKNKIESVKKTLDKMETVFPHQIVSYKYQAGEFADFCYELELTDRGDAFIKNEVKHIHNFFKNIETKKELSYFDNQNIKMMLYSANLLVRIADVNERTAFEDLANEFQPYLMKYN